MPLRLPSGLAAAAASLIVVLLACGDTRHEPSDEAVDVFPSASTCTSFDVPRGLARPVRVYPELTFVAPVQALADDLSRSVYVVELMGAIKRFDDRPDVTESEVALDLADVIYQDHIEDGLLGLALERRDDGVAGIVKYTAAPRPGATGVRVVVARVRSDDGGRTFRRDTLEEILSIDQPNSLHHGGPPAFGRDGMLYVPVGDGTWDDPRPSQDLRELSGKILRIDVRTQPYTTPHDNPFVGTAGARGEIWAYGLRNPHGWSFDPEQDGVLWVGDVGWATWEELDRVTVGANLGWPLFEGKDCRVPPCPSSGFVEPVHTYPTSGGAAIVGGPVYRGSRLPGLAGRVIVADWQTGRFDAVSRATPGDVTLVDETGLNIMSVSLDARGELLFTEATGKLYTLEPREPGRLVPGRLSQTGCVDVRDPRRAPEGLFPYEVNMPLWSDDTEKARMLALPEGGQLRRLEDESFEAPVGAVLVKTFFWQKRPIETRLFIRHRDGAWAGYSYQWRPDGRDADLLEHTKTDDVGGLVWVYPNRSQCLGCHTESAGRTLGLDVAQLNREVSDGHGGAVNQLERLEQLGLVEGLGAPGALPRFPTREDETADDATWSRAYLHANCSHCHRPGAPGRGGANLLATVPTSSAGCDVPPEVSDLGIDGARVIVPGAPEASLLFLRMTATDATRMPPLGTLHPDPIATRRIGSWIRGMTECESGF